MTPKPETFRSTTMMSSLSINDGNESETLNSNNASVGSQMHSHNHPMCKFEHSFSQSEIDDRFNQPKNSGDKPLHIRELRSDFVHLHSIKVHSNSPTDHSHPLDEHTYFLNTSSNGSVVVDTSGPRITSDRKEGFQLRSLRAITKDTKKIVVVVPSIDLDRKELRR